VTVKITLIHSKENRERKKIPRDVECFIRSWCDDEEGEEAEEADD
jgi:hypothetical protein